MARLWRGGLCGRRAAAGEAGAADVPERKRVSVWLRARTACGRLGYRAGRQLADGVNEVAAPFDGGGVARGEAEAGVEDATLAGDGGLGHVEGAAQMDGHVAGAGGQVDLGQVDAGLATRRPHECAVRTGEHA